MTIPTPTPEYPSIGRPRPGHDSRRRISPYGLGLLIGAAFGLVDIVANAGVALRSPAALLLRVLGVAAFIGVVLVVGRTRPTLSGGAGVQFGFGRRYWLVVVAEVAAMGVGNAVLSGPLGTPDAAVAWISVVVGVHFLALAALWRASFVRRLGIAIAMCGAVGLVAAAAGSTAAVIAIIGGLAPGVLLLGSAYWGSAVGGGASRP